MLTEVLLDCFDPVFQVHSQTAIAMLHFYLRFTLWVQKERHNYVRRLKNTANFIEL